MGNRKEDTMKWFKRKLSKWVREIENEKKYMSEAQALPVEDTPQSEPVLGFKIYSAQNGQVLEFFRYNKLGDMRNNSIYIIDKDTDISEYVSKCLSLEMLK